MATIGAGQREAAKALGRKQFTMKVGGGSSELTFRPLSIGQRVELEQRTFTGENDATMWVLFASAQRGGYPGTIEEFAELLEGDEIIEASEKLGELTPLTTAAGKQMVEAMRKQGIDPATVVTGTA